MEFKKWTKIHSFHNVRKLAKKDARAGYGSSNITYHAKVKLDGTNAAIRLTKDSEGNTLVKTQSRGRFITPDDDNYGFAAWAAEEEQSSWLKYLQDGLNYLYTTYDVTVYGEWCGKGIQKRTSISKIDRKVFCLFSVSFILNEGPLQLISEPASIKSFTRAVYSNDVYVIPWHDLSPDILDLTYDTTKITINWTDDEPALRLNADFITSRVDECEECDPFVKATFNVEGLGEGLVFYPISGAGASLSYEEATRYMFKAKGEKHAVVNRPTRVPIDPLKTKILSDFAAAFVTDNRVQQCIEECDLEPEQVNTGKFLKWMGTDIKSECQDSLEESELVWKDVSKSINNLARQKWFSLCETS